MTQEKQNQQDASGDKGQNQQPPTTNQQVNPPAQPKVEVKDGAIFVDGKKVVPESDLIAAKKNLQTQIESAQTTHNEAVDKLRLQVSEAQQASAKANAELEEAKKARTAGDISADELAKIKARAEKAEADLAKSNTTTLDMRRKLIMTTYNIPANSDLGKGMAEKTAAQLDSLEEALKALGHSRGPGNYAIGPGGNGATPIADLDRAKALISSTPYRGVRNEQPQGAK